MNACVEGIGEGAVDSFQEACGLGEGVIFVVLFDEADGDEDLEDGLELFGRLSGHLGESIQIALTIAQSGDGASFMGPSQAVGEGIGMQHREVEIDCVVLRLAHSGGPCGRLAIGSYAIRHVSG